MRPLQEKLQSLQCHFTWRFEIKGKVDATHILQTLALQTEHTLYRNRSTYIALRAYLHQLQGDNLQALSSLRDAEESLKREHPANFSRQALVIYGNYAWIYYHLANYEMVEVYLGRIREICRSLSSPEPYSVLSPEVQAQKGWSLLSVGFRNGEEAKECFQMALRGDRSSEEFQAGLACSVFACWTHSWASDLREEATRLMEEILLSQPHNDEVKVYLASLLQKVDKERANRLVEEAVQSSLNPEVLRNGARVWRPQCLPRAIAILQEAVALHPSYHLLHYDLGLCYKMQLERASPDEREAIVAAAIESFKRAVETDAASVFSRLELAHMYGEKAPDYEEEIYQDLMDGLPSTSKRCQQAIYLHWGDFLLHKKGLKLEALEMYAAGFRIVGGHSKEWGQLRGRLIHLAQIFQKDSEVDQADAVSSILQAMEDLRLGRSGRSPPGGGS